MTKKFYEKQDLDIKCHWTIHIIGFKDNRSSTTLKSKVNESREIKGGKKNKSHEIEIYFIPCKVRSCYLALWYMRLRIWSKTRFYHLCTTGVLYRAEIWTFCGVLFFIFSVYLHVGFFVFVLLMYSYLYPLFLRKYFPKLKVKTRRIMLRS